MKRAIISVSNKKQIIELTEFLLSNEFEIYSTGGTYKLIYQHQLSINNTNNNIKQISELTGFPEILNGRVKTLHPHIYAGLLADTKNEDHMKDLKTHNLSTIDLVVCNLYPFVTDNSIENIDIGGVTLLRASSKNHENIVVLSKPSQYNNFMTNYTTSNENNHKFGYSLDDRKELGRLCFDHVSAYDKNISQFLIPNSEKIILKYGMNPHQTTTEVSFNDNLNKPFTLLNGTLGMINIIDIIHGWLTVKEIDNVLDIPCAISMKHTSLAGLAVGNDINETTLNYYNMTMDDTDKFNPVSIAFMKSRLGDPLSSFGDMICISREIDVLTANLIKGEITDGICAPSYTDEAMEILKLKKGGAFKIVKMNVEYYDNMIANGWTESKEIYGIKLSQTNNNYINHFNEITDRNLRIDYVLANSALKYAQSNNISMAVNGQIIGMGCGQQNRVGCVKLAGDKGNNWLLRQTDNARHFWNANKGIKRQQKVNMLYEHMLNNYMTTEELEKYQIVLASDGFFPFNDNIILAHKYGVKHIIHPGGSINDDSISKQCQDLNINLSVTSHRMFYH
jgi:phosphoribosylaminoimidazolecarboxamide formyltransferase/IMP cyclohydrolase